MAVQTHWLYVGGGTALCKSGYGLSVTYDPHNPLNLPGYTLRLQYEEGTTPEFHLGTATHVSQSPNIWDLTYRPTTSAGIEAGWSYLLSERPGTGVNIPFVTGSKLVAILGANPVNIKSMYQICIGCDELLTVSNFDFGYTSANAAWMFGDCSKLSSVQFLDTSLVTSMVDLFNSCSSLTTVNTFRTDSLQETTALFYLCTSLVTPPFLDTHAIRYMSQMFEGCTSLKNVPEYDTSSCTYMVRMFYNCYSIEAIPTFNTTYVTDMTNMFKGCTSLVTAPAFNTARVESMKGMYQDCSSLKNIPLYNIQRVEDMIDTFNGCVNVESGAYALYQAASSGPDYIPAELHARTFRQCGSNTTTGSAELAMIPGSWK